MQICGIIKRVEFVIIGIRFVLYFCMTKCLLLSLFNECKSEKEYNVKIFQTDSNRDISIIKSCTLFFVSILYRINNEEWFKGVKGLIIRIIHLFLDWLLDLHMKLKCLKYPNPL